MSSISYEWPCVNFVVPFSLCFCTFLLCIVCIFKDLIKSFLWIVWFVELQLYSEGKLYSSTSLFLTIAFHIDTTSLADGTYELIQEPDGDFSEAQANIIELTEVPNSDSEEPQTTDSIDFNTGKSRCIIILFYAIFYTYFLVHLSYWSWMKT